MTPFISGGGFASITTASVDPTLGGRGVIATSAARDQAEEISNWKLNCPFLYDYIATHVLVWPSLTVEILPTGTYDNTSLEDEDESQEIIQTLLLGTHTAEGEDNSVVVMNVLLPNESIKPENRIYEVHEDYGGFYYGSLNQKFRIRGTIPHLIGEPNKVRSMPHDRTVFGTISVGGSVTVFNTRSHFSGKSESEISTVSLVGHDEEGWGLSWSPLKIGWLATAADDMKVCIWDIQTRNEPSSSSSLRSKVSTKATTSDIPPILTFQEHTASAQDVIWSPSQEAIIMSVGDDGKMIVYDIRQPNPAQKIQCSHNPVNTISISPIRPTLIATGGADRISRVEFCPSNERFLASCGGDRSVLVWDLYSIGKEQTSDDANDGPPELLFTHTGHSSIVNDLTWNPNPGFEESETIYGDEDSDEEEDDGFQLE